MVIEQLLNGHEYVLENTRAENSPSTEDTVHILLLHVNTLVATQNNNRNKKCSIVTCPYLEFQLGNKYTMRRTLIIGMKTGFERHLHFNVLSPLMISSDTSHSLKPHP